MLNAFFADNDLKPITKTRKDDPPNLTRPSPEHHKVVQKKKLEKKEKKESPFFLSYIDRVRFQRAVLTAPSAVLELISLQQN